MAAKRFATNMQGTAVGSSPSVTRLIQLFGCGWRESGSRTAISKSVDNAE